MLSTFGSSSERIVGLTDLLMIGFATAVDAERELLGWNDPRWPELVTAYRAATIASGGHI